MDCIYLGNIPTIKENFYKADEACIVNLHVCNGHNSAVTVTIALNMAGGTSISIYQKSMSAGDTFTLNDIYLKEGMIINGTAGTGGVVGIKLDKQ